MICHKYCCLKSKKGQAWIKQIPTSQFSEEGLSEDYAEDIRKHFQFLFYKEIWVMISSVWKEKLNYF